MTYLFDTNVVSELRRPRPSREVVAFIADIDPALIYVSVLSLGEIRKGAAIKRRSDAQAAARLDFGWRRLNGSSESAS